MRMHHQILIPNVYTCKRASIPIYRFEIEGKAFINASQDEDEPKTYQDALLSLDFEKWKVVI